METHADNANHTGIIIRMMVIATPNGEKKSHGFFQSPQVQKLSQNLVHLHRKTAPTLTKKFSYLDHHEFLSRYTFGDTESVVT